MSRILFVAAVVAVASLLISRAQSSALPETWPPQVDQDYPNLSLQNHRGEVVSFEQFKGKVVLVEPVGMDCPACQAFAGADRWGSFGGVRPQGNLPSARDLVARYSHGSSLDDTDLVFVQILFYGMDRRGAPTVEDAAAWATHFRMDSSPNHHVLIGTPEFIGPETYNMIPGFQLIDRQGKLRVDATGHHPRDDLYRELCPTLSECLEE